MTRSGERDSNDQVQLKLRFREETRAKLEAAAKAAGTSLNSEIVRRLEESLGEDDRLGGDQTAALLRTVAFEINRAERATGRSWLEDTATFAAGRLLAAEVFKRATPPPANAADLMPIYRKVTSMMRLRDELKEFLVESHVLRERRNTLADLMIGGTPTLVTQPESEWTFADGTPLDECGELRQKLRELLAQYQRLLAEMSELLDQAEPLQDLQDEAEKEGQAIFRSLSRS